MRDELYTTQIVATEVTETRYDAYPLNWQDVLEDPTLPHDDTPTVEAVADVIRKHPHAKIRYLGGYSRIVGGGLDGIHIELAREMAGYPAKGHAA